MRKTQTEDPQGARASAAATGHDDSADRAFLRALVEGSHQRHALGRAFLERHRSDLLGLAIAAVGNEAAGEVVARVFAKVVDGAPFFRGESLVRTWLHSILNNAITDQRRRETVQRRRLTELPDAEDARDALEGHLAEHLVTMQTRFDRIALARALDAFERWSTDRETCRQLVRLHLIEGYTYEEILAHIPGPGAQDPAPATATEAAAKDPGVAGDTADQGTLEARLRSHLYRCLKAFRALFVSGSPTAAGSNA
ncbi:MAG: RNA polymerase sigma factor [Burkholderiaceae bacterium]